MITTHLVMFSFLNGAGTAAVSVQLTSIEFALAKRSITFVLKQREIEFSLAKRSIDFELN